MKSSVQRWPRRSQLAGRAPASVGRHGTRGPGGARRDGRRPPTAHALSIGGLHRGEIDVGAATDVPGGRTYERIVVGVDGSDGSIAALRWSLDVAAAHGALVEVVHVWRLPHLLDLAGAAGATIWAGQVQDGAWYVLQAVIERAGSHSVRIVPNLVQGAAIPVMLERSRVADLLVLGAPTSGRLWHRIFGSVSRSCQAGAACPVVLVSPLYA